MSDEDRFAKLMEQSGVVPLGDKRDTRARRTEKRARAAASDRNAEAEFEAAMAALDRVPNKDRAVRPSAPKHVSMVRFRPRERVHIDASIDLHGLTETQAITRLSGFIPTSFTDRCRLVAIIVGKGLHSKDGISVLRPAVERWLQLDGDAFVEEYGDAPRAHGGSGVILVRLRMVRRG